MKTLTFRVVPLPTEVAERARRASEAGAADHAVVIADSPTGYPCRHCLRFAKPGERLILFPYAAIPAGHPYSETGPIFVHAEPCERYRATHEYPEDFRGGRAFRRHIFYRSSHDGNFLPAHLPGEKAGARERRFLREFERSAGQRLSSVS